MVHLIYNAVFFAASCAGLVLCGLPSRVDVALIRWLREKMARSHIAAFSCAVQYRYPGRPSSAENAKLLASKLSGDPDANGGRKSIFLPHRPVRDDSQGDG